MNEEILLIVESLEKYKDLLESKNDEVCDGMTEDEKRARWCRNLPAFPRVAY